MAQSYRTKIAGALQVGMKSVFLEGGSKKKKTQRSLESPLKAFEFIWLLQLPSRPYPGTARSQGELTDIFGAALTLSGTQKGVLNCFARRFVSAGELLSKILSRRNNRLNGRFTQPCWLCSLAKPLKDKRSC
jgi:hypothetical protein